MQQGKKIIKVLKILNNKRNIEWWRVQSNTDLIKSDEYKKNTNFLKNI